MKVVPAAKSPTVQGKEAADASSQVAALRNKLADLTSTLKVRSASTKHIDALFCFREVTRGLEVLNWTIRLILTSNIRACICMQTYTCVENT
jgi:hypothetical protein